MFEGLLPIVPVKEMPQRLTAMQNKVCLTTNLLFSKYNKLISKIGTSKLPYAADAVYKQAKAFSKIKFPHLGVEVLPSTGNTNDFYDDSSRTNKNQLLIPIGAKTTNSDELPDNKDYESGKKVIGMSYNSLAKQALMPLN
jgi:hypothetical protein